MQRKFILIFADFILFLALPLFANMSRLEMRERLLYAEHEEIEKMQVSRLNKVEIGEWQEIIEDAIFALVRRSELYRGHIKIVVFQDRKVVCKIYPDLSVFISSGLLEYIDDFLFSSLSDSLRRAKNINADREECLATFLSFGVSRFALDIDVKKYASTGRLPSKILEKNDIFLLDKMTAVFLKVAGYRSNLILEHFERLKKTIQNDAGVYTFQEEYLQNIDMRLKILDNEKDSIEKLSEEILNIIFQINTQQGIEELIQSIQLLRSSYPQSIYFLRLEVVARHSLLLENFSSITFIPLLPSAIMGHTYAEKYYTSVENKLKKFPFISNAKTPPKSKVDEELILQAKVIYEEYFSKIEEDVALSSYFTVLAMGNSENMKAEAIKKAGAMLQIKGISLAQKINCAITFLCSNEHVKKGIDILESIVGEKAVKNFLKDTYFFDERLILYNYVLSLSREDHIDKSKIRVAIQKLEDEVYSNVASSSLIVRSLKIGDETDKLTKLWGEPSSIVYNYYFEKWVYNSLKALVVISSYSQVPKVMQIILLPSSTVSLVGDVRIGDDRATFEKQFGHSIYRAGDYEVYFYEREALYVLYSNADLVRSISIFQAFRKN